MTDELKPVRCGCGGEPYLKYDDGAYSVICTKCGIETKGYCNHFDDFKSAKEYATKDWNRAMGERSAKVETYTDDQQETWSVCECGTDVWKSYNYCPECGARLEW